MHTARGVKLRLGRRAFLVASAAAVAASALGRTRYAGTLRLKLPWPIDGLDPHVLDDPTAALFGSAVCDSLFALDTQGRPYPTLASGMPEKTARGSRVKLRPFLTTAAGRALDARDVVWSLARARRQAAVGLLSRFETPTIEPGEAFSIIVPNAEPFELALALASPVVAILPRGFSRLRPDATGGFVALPSRDKLVLKRNLLASRGAAFLDAIEVTRALDLADALRSFEAGDSDVGWLGAGYHRPRPSAIRFDAGALGWVVMRTGNEAAAWAAPGVAQRLLDTIPAAQLAHLGLRGLGTSGGSAAWGGAPAELLVADDSPQLIEVARALAALFTRPAHEVRAAPRPRAELAQRRVRGNYSLMLDFVRSIGPAGPKTLFALLAAADPNLARRPPRAVSFDPRQIARTLSLGVVGQLHIAGAHMPDVHGLGEWNLPGASRRAGA